jgi:alpha-galactosidase
MNVKIKAVGAYYTPDGVVADSPKNPKYAEYTVNEGENTYELIITASYAPAAVSLRIPVEIDAGDTVFMNGFQSATASREHTVADKVSGFDAVSAYARRLYAEKIGGDYSIVKYKNKPGVTHGFSYCYFRSGDKIRLFASLDESTGYTVFKYDAWSATLKVSKDIEGVKCFNNYKAVSLFYAEGSEDEVFDKWFDYLGKSENLPAEPLVGYSTKKLSVINEDVVNTKIKAVKENFPTRPNVFIVDGKYCKHGDWLDCDEQKFPIGLRYISDSIKADRMMAGLCISPFTVEENSDVYENHREWLVRSTDGRFLRTKKNLFVLDSENVEVREYVRQVIHTILYMWGFDLIKLDNLFVAGLYPSGGKSRGEKMCSAMSFLRECCGGKLLYADHTPLMPAFGIADYCAVSCDAMSDNIPTIPAKKIFRESPSVRNAAADIVFRRHLNKRAFLNAPCPVSLDDKENILDTRLNNAEQNVLTNLEGLFTSVLITIDSTAKYNQRKKRRFKRMCNLGAKAQDVSVKKTVNGFLASYKYEGKSYLVKFR